MIITFHVNKLRKICNDSNSAIRKFGNESGKLLMQRFDDLQAADCLEDMRYLPGRCHELAGDRKGQISIDLKHPYRLIFKPDENPYPRKTDGGLDWIKVKSIKIISVEDTHG